MQFNFDKEVNFNNSIEIEDIGNFCIKCTNDNLQEWYLVCSTLHGKSYIFQFGPITPDIEELDSFNVSFYSVDFTKPTLKKIIDQLINDKYKCIKYVDNINITDLNEAYIEPYTYFIKNYLQNGNKML